MERIEKLKSVTSHKNCCGESNSSTFKEFVR